jgi:chorismate mutase
MTWQLINARMKLSEEVGKTKKTAGKKVVVDKVRYEKVIEQAQAHAPENAREEIRKLYELIHDISVRIQSEIIGTS